MAGSPDTTTQPAAPDAAALAPDFIYVAKLAKPIQAYGKEVTELKFREPTALDIEVAGMPVTLDQGYDPPRMVFNAREMTAMMATLANVPPSSIRQMRTVDWTNAAWTLGLFFTPRAGEV